MDKKLILIDGSSFCYRAFYALQGFSTSWGLPTGAVFGFNNMISKIVEDFSPEYVAVCFDVSRQTFRKEEYQEYKSNRPPTPDKLSLQFPFIKRLLEAFNIPILEKEGFEADDVIATLVKRFSNKAMIVIVTQDKDMLQLVQGKKVLVYNSLQEKLFDPAKVEEKMGIPAGNISDYLALVGDSSDNIPGAKGIGPKAACRLIREFGSIKDILLHKKNITPQKTQDLIKESEADIKLSKRLAILHSDVKLDVSLKDLKTASKDYVALYRLYSELEFKTLLKKLPPLPSKNTGLSINKCKAEDLSKLKEVVFTADEEKKAVFLMGDDCVMEIPASGAKEILEDQKVKKVSFDLKNQKRALKACGVNLSGVYFDVNLACYLDNPSIGTKSLDQIYLTYFTDSVDCSTPENFLYATSRLYKHLKKVLQEKKLSDLFFNIEMPLIDVLFAMEEEGISMDAQHFKEFSAQLEGDIFALLQKIYEISGITFNVNSPKQLRTILFERLSLPVLKKTKTGPSTDESVLERLKKHHPLPEYLLEYRRLVKAKSTYVQPLLEWAREHTGKIHTTFHQARTATGRLSSSNPNMQNIPVPREELGVQIRKAFVPSVVDGLLVSFDYSQIELRVLAHVSGDKNLIKAFVENKDIHRFTASLIFDVGEAEVDKSMRESAKRVNFGIIYGMSCYALARDLKISFEEAQRFIDEYFLRYPGVKKYIDKTIKEMEKEGFVTTISGRRRYLPQIKSGDASLRDHAQRQARNFPVQGSSADIIKIAMINVARKLKEEGLKSVMCLQIHDELLFDVRKDELGKVKNIVKYEMENACHLKVPLEVEVKLGKNWGQLTKSH